MMGHRDAFTLEADSKSVPLARHAVTAFAREHGVPADVVGGIALAVSEACTNVVLHAYEEQARGRVAIDLALKDTSLCVRVSDDGIGMRPRADSPGLGLGLPIIASTADGIVIAPTEGGGTELRMRFDLPAAA